MSSIRRVLISAHGGPSNIQVVTETLPDPSKGETQVDVIYSGFSGSDINMRLGVYPQQKMAPLNPGYCFIGRVASNGPKSEKFKPGALVAAISVYESEATKINIAEKYLVSIPETVDVRQALALVLDWNTAYGLVHRATTLVGKGQRIFIHGMSGAVGYAVMTLCLLEGAEVYGTANERNHEALRALGAHPFTYKDKQWMTEMESLGGAHVVYDALGFESWDESWSILIRDEPSRLVGFGGNLNVIQGTFEKPRSQLPGLLKLLAKNGCMWSKRSTSFYYIDRDHSTFMPDVYKLLDMLVEGKIEVPVKKVWDLENVREAHEQWNKNPGMGSCMIRVDTSA
ncbi:chaperonin 10-like protein [Plectosphaerella plurivora]|uniref:Chaperonin 10-like protein n=1 Tax=Plectosphaerella plurivora TaxID=936078 RepID=A0A9P8VKC6_9PEZI|nr:chaperonin 10-like protein [Plectosphaerella plurivora]